MTKQYYLAYGSNLNLKQMMYRCPEAKAIGSTFLVNKKLAFKGNIDGLSYLTVENSEGSMTPVGIFEVSSNDIKNLDRFEGYPAKYRKEYIPIIVDGKEVLAMYYVMRKWINTDYHIPSELYVGTCIAGYEDFGFSLDFLREGYNDTLAKRYKKENDVDYFENHTGNLVKVMR